MEKQYLKELIAENKDIIYQDEFFDKLKATSLLEFRKNIDMVQEIRPTLFLEQMVMKYYEELLSQYDKKAYLFLEYKKILDCFKKRDYEYLDNYHTFHYFVDKKMIIKLQDFCHYEDKEKMAYDYLIKATNQKISEIVVDGLFQDTIYNVWINLRELLRFHDALGDKAKFIEEERLNFYRSILEIDRTSCEDKIEMYKKLRDKQIHLLFYQDLRRTKDIAYQDIKKSLFKIGQDKNLINKMNSSKYGVPVHELKGEDFYMVVRCKESFSDKDVIRRNCYTLISSYNMQVFARNKFIYGYDSFDIDHILHMFEKDSYSSSGRINDRTLNCKYVNRIMKPSQISDSPGYSEIQIVNKKSQIGDEYDVLRPSYLVVFDTIEDKHIMEAKRLQIPIVKIDTEPYLARRMECYEKTFHLGFLEYERVRDDYTNGEYDEEERKHYR